MVVALALATLAFRPADYVVARCADAHRALAASTVTATVDVVGLFSRQKVTYHLAYDRAQGADVTIERARPFRVVVTPDTVYAYDAKSRQFSERPRTDAELDVTVKQAAMVMDELVAGLVAPEGVGRWLQGVVGQGGWRSQASAGLTTVACGSGPNVFQVSLDPESRLLRQVVLKSDKYGTTWRFSYGPGPKALAFTPPPGSFKTKEIKPGYEPPVYSSAAARRATERVFARYERPSALGYSVRSDSGETQVWVGRGKARQSDANADWSVDGKRFLLWDKGAHRLVEGEAKLSAIVDSVVKAGSRVDPVLLALLRGNNPARGYLGMGANVVVAGTLTLRGQPCSILEATGQSAKTTVIARDSDGFVMSVGMVPLGAGTDGTQRVFTPLKVEQGSFALSVPSGIERTSVKSYLGR